MNKAELERMLEEQAGNNRKAGFGINRDKIRMVLNYAFMALALLGILIYFFDTHITGWIIIGVALVIKVIEFLIRFLL